MYKEKEPEYLCQGDIILNYITDSLFIFEPQKFYKGLLVISFTCDLKHEDLRYIKVCPIFSFELLIKILFQKFENECANSKEKNKPNCIRKNILNFLGEHIFNYKDYKYFFLIPNSDLENEALFADLDQITNIPIKEYNDLIKHRKKSLENPWIEKLGFQIGHQFNRIAIDEISDNFIEDFLQSNCYPIINKIGGYCDKGDKYEFELAIDGNEIMKILDIEPSEKVGEIKKILKSKIEEGILENTNKEICEFLTKEKLILLKEKKNNNLRD